MFNAVAFFKKRFQEHIKELSRYLRYIFNGHIAFAMFFFISVFAVYYQKWLQSLTPEFPVALIIGAVFGFIASYSPVRTLLKEPDLIFLRVAEEKMQAYFNLSLLYSFCIQLYIVAVAGAAFGPLYMARYEYRNGKTYLFILAVLLILKGWNLLANWWTLKERTPRRRFVEQTIRFAFNVAIFYFLIIGYIFIAIILTVLFIVFILWSYKRSLQIAGLNWELLVEKEQHSMQLFYRLANMFTDVPHLKSKLHKRRLLVKLFARVKYRKETSFDYLYKLTFIRSGDYLSMYIRLTVLGGLVIYFIPVLLLKVLFVLLFSYITIFQMMPLYQHHRLILWMDLYPLTKIVRYKSISKLLSQLGFIQVLCLNIVFIIEQNWFGLLYGLIGGIVFVYIFITFYVKRTFEKMTKS